MKRCLFAALFAFATASALAQDAYPSRPITMIVPFPPGGVADITGRPTAAAMEKLLKQPVVVANRSGAGGAVGNAAVANAKPDGYTILMALSSITVIPAADALFARKPAYSLDQFMPIALISADPTLLVVHPSLPVKSLKELVALARSKPGQMSFSSSGIYGALHMPMEMFLHAAKLKMRHLPTNGGGPAITALLGGHVELTAGGPAAISGHVKAGKMRPIVSWGGKRHEAFPAIPTFKELGYDIEYYIWAGMFAPRGTPEPVMKVLRDAARKTVEDPDFKKTMANVNSPIQYMDAPEFAKYWEADGKRLAALVKVVGKVEAQK
ncbi:MAG: tripartite tricarboxylate transporter substrate binding protein [Betaproteobacteria bacterium]|nr:tripartite tricarboxylate transporter substrate binding protein [Betaproteobacteria bacterium]MBI2226374.1 tripartite tricarboxylate transporter substrate binding protein [Betaproteobacteria bacterium]MBI3054254.1 tripartite tricarboxylate transporter substrate binding protein [Betaproteobacteria bacterium]